MCITSTVQYQNLERRIVGNYVTDERVIAKINLEHTIFENIVHIINCLD